MCFFVCHKREKCHWARSFPLDWTVSSFHFFVKFALKTKSHVFVDFFFWIIFFLKKIIVFFLKKYFFLRFSITNSIQIELMTQNKSVVSFFPFYFFRLLNKYYVNHEYENLSTICLFRICANHWRKFATIPNSLVVVFIETKKQKKTTHWKKPSEKADRPFEFCDEIAKIIRAQ